MYIHTSNLPIYSSTTELVGKNRCFFITVTVKEIKMRTKTIWASWSLKSTAIFFKTLMMSVKPLYVWTACEHLVLMTDNLHWLQRRLEKTKKTKQNKWAIRKKHKQIKKTWIYELHLNNHLFHCVRGLLWLCQQPLLQQKQTNVYLFFTCHKAIKYITVSTPMWNTRREHLAWGPGRGPAVEVLILVLWVCQ